MSIEALLKAVPPPSKPSEPFLGPWEAIEAEVGTALPQDYKDFARLYGSGYFMQFLGVAIPRTRNENTRFEARVGIVCDAYRTTFQPEKPPFPLWPDPQGLLPFGSTDNGDDLFWHRCGPPDSWTVVISDCDLFEFLDCNLTDFLAGLATGQVRPRELPALLPCDCLFKPDDEPNGPGPIFTVHGRFGLSGYQGVGAVSSPPHHRGGVPEAGRRIRLRARLMDQGVDGPGD